MSLEKHLEFQEKILKALNFCPKSLESCTRWDNKENPEDGFLILYERKGFYSLAVAQYTVHHNFSISFQDEEPLLRFGNFYTGITHFKIDGVKADSSTPDSFLVLEGHLKGQQFWKKGEQYCGIEVSIAPSFVELLKTVDPHFFSVTCFTRNVTYHWLPTAAMTTLRQLTNMAVRGTLTPLILEGCILQCLGSISESVKNGQFSLDEKCPSTMLGNRQITFSSFDLSAISQAYQILTDHPESAPSIPELSKLLLLNEQKLKAGFQMCYHISIGQYVHECRMTKAAQLLGNTSLSVLEISHETGYKSCASFIKAFRKFYQKTPLQFRASQKTSQQASSSQESFS